MNRNVAELIKQAVTMIELDTYLKKMKVKDEYKDVIGKMSKYMQYEIIRCMQDIVLMERL